MSHPPAAPPSRLMQRIIAGITLGIAFTIMASIFVPPDSRASDGHHDPDGPGGRIDHRSAHRPADAARDGSAGHGHAAVPVSVDAHEGLSLLGEVEHRRYRVEVYATDHEPRYSIYDAADGRVLGTLLTLEKAQARFPDLPLRDADFSAPSHGPLMMADPDRMY